MYLNCHSYYSLRYGTLSPEELVAGASRLGIEALALTDINNSTGMVDFVAGCMLQGIKPIGGTEFRNESHRLLYIVLAINNRGFLEINDFLTWHNLNKAPLPPCPPVFTNALTIYPFSNKLPRKLKENEFVGIHPHEIRKLVSSPLQHLQEKLLALYPVTFAGESDFVLHQYLRAIDKNTLLTKLSVNDLALPDEKFLSNDLFRIAYDEYPEILEIPGGLLISAICRSISTQ